LQAPVRARTRTPPPERNSMSPRKLPLDQLGSLARGVGRRAGDVGQQVGGRAVALLPGPLAKAGGKLLGAKSRTQSPEPEAPAAKKAAPEPPERKAGDKRDAAAAAPVPAESAKQAPAEKAAPAKKATPAKKAAPT